MMMEMGIDQEGAGGFRAPPDIDIGAFVEAIHNVGRAAERTAAGVSNWCLFVLGGNARSWAGYHVDAAGMRTYSRRARRMRERQMRRRRHAGHHGGIRRATLLRAGHKMAPPMVWA